MEKETDLIYEGIATWYPASGRCPGTACGKETDLIYEGIATADRQRMYQSGFPKETDLIYEGIATRFYSW